MRQRGSLAVFVALAVVAGQRRGLAAVQLETFLQESVFDQAELDSPNLTVGTSPQQLLIVALATGNLAVETQQVEWNGEPLRRFESRSLTAPAGPCRLELWMLFDPKPGAGPLFVSLSAATGFGLGAVVYSGVDREAPFGPLEWKTGSGGSVSVDLPAPGSRPVLGAACLGGAWTTGPTLTTPEAITGPGEDELWNFTEPRVVGLGSHRVAMNGRARVSWDITGSEPYEWLAMGVSIKPLVELLPDAGPDAERDGATDVSDGPADRGMSADLAVPTEEDAGADAAGVADVHWRVGCACDTGRRGHGPAWPALVLALLIARPRRPRSR
jgi:MYXO-CTERM domain-containing protein